MLWNFLMNFKANIYLNIHLNKKTLLISLKYNYYVRKMYDESNYSTSFKHLENKNKVIDVTGLLFYFTKVFQYRFCSY